MDQGSGVGMKLTVEINDFIAAQSIVKNEEGEAYFRPSKVPRWLDLKVVEPDPPKRGGRPKKESNEVSDGNG